MRAVSESLDHQFSAQSSTTKVWIELCFQMYMPAHAQATSMVRLDESHPDSQHQVFADNPYTPFVFFHALLDTLIDHVVCGDA